MKQLWKITLNSVEHTCSTIWHFIFSRNFSPAFSIEPRFPKENRPSCLFIFIFEAIVTPTLFYFNDLKRNYNKIKVRFIRIILYLYIQHVVKCIFIADFPTKSLKVSTPLPVSYDLRRFFFINNWVYQGISNQLVTRQSRHHCFCAQTQ